MAITQPVVLQSDGVFPQLPHWQLGEHSQPARAASCQQLAALAHGGSRDPGCHSARLTALVGPSGRPCHVRVTDRQSVRILILGADKKYAARLHLSYGHPWESRQLP